MAALTASLFASTKPAERTEEAEEEAKRRVFIELATWRSKERGNISSPSSSLKVDQRKTLARTLWGMESMASRDVSAVDTIFTGTLPPSIAALKVLELLRGPEMEGMPVFAGARGLDGPTPFLS
ncbi:MAG: hypothetical protein GY721_00700 [Deltaproteobacteria bacterium]|nr:hypothetical protein [Deltaproteobacteria bacterium]